MQQNQVKSQYRIEDGKIIKNVDDSIVEDGTIENIIYLNWLSQGNMPDGIDDIA